MQSGTGEVASKGSDRDEEVEAEEQQPNEFDP